MSTPYPEPLTRLIEQLQKWPGVGAKTAQRLAFHVLKAPREDAERLAEALHDVMDDLVVLGQLGQGLRSRGAGVPARRRGLKAAGAAPATPCQARPELNMILIQHL